VKRLPTSGPLELTDADMTGRRPGAWSPPGTAAPFTRPPRPYLGATIRVRRPERGGFAL